MKPNNQTATSSEPNQSTNTTQSPNNPQSTTSTTKLDTSLQDVEPSPLQIQPIVTPTARTEVITPPPVITPSPAPIQTQVNRQTQINIIGWVRLGSVNNTNGSFSYGEPLIATSQPVTVYPPVVPSTGSIVTVVTGLNLRQDLPQAPNYRLANKIGELSPNQKLVILSVRTFVDSNSDSPYTKVWAEVGIP